MGSLSSCRWCLDRAGGALTCGILSAGVPAIVLAGTQDGGGVTYPAIVGTKHKETDGQGRKPPKLTDTQEQSRRDDEPQWHAPSALLVLVDDGFSDELQVQRDRA